MTPDITEMSLEGIFSLLWPAGWLGICVEYGRFNMNLRAMLSLHEGRKNKVYKDSLGIETIGVGRNARDKGLSDAEVDFLLDNDIAECVADLKGFEWFAGLNQARQDALTDMRFNVGPAGFRQFQHMILALAAGDFEEAARQMESSQWHHQVGQRAITLEAMIRTGEYA